MQIRIDIGVHDEGCSLQAVSEGHYLTGRGTVRLPPGDLLHIAEAIDECVDNAAGSSEVRDRVLVALREQLQATEKQIEVDMGKTQEKQRLIRLIRESL